MSSKVIKKNACIFTYGVDDKKSFLIANLCNGQGIEYRRMKEEDRFQKIGWIAGYSGYVKNENKHVPLESKKETVPAGNGKKQPEVMIFSALSEKQLEAFLEGYKAMGIEPVSLKAVVTKHNENWTFDELVQELIREHAAILLGQMKKDR